MRPYVSKVYKTQEEIIEDAAEEFLWHFWLAEILENGGLAPLYENVLCWKATGRMPPMPNGKISVTIDKSVVTCQECLEWLYA